MRKIITYGTFDLFHVGHLEILRRLRSIADYVLVGVSTDEFNAGKGKRAIFPYEQRASIVRSIRYVDQVIPEESWDQKVSDIERYSIDAFAIGDDWRGKFDFLESKCEVIYLPRTPDISTTEIKQSLSLFSGVNRDELLRLFDILERLKADLLP